MQYRIVKLNNGKYRVQGRMPLWFWLNGIWNGEQWLDYIFESTQQALEYLDKILTESRAEKIQQIIGIVKK